MSAFRKSMQFTSHESPITSHGPWLLAREIAPRFGVTPRAVRKVIPLLAPEEKERVKVRGGWAWRLLLDAVAKKIGGGSSTVAQNGEQRSSHENSVRGVGPFPRNESGPGLAAAKDSPPALATAMATNPAAGPNSPLESEGAPDARTPPPPDALALPAQSYLEGFEPPSPEIVQSLARIHSAAKRAQAEARWRIIRPLTDPDFPRGLRLMTVRALAHKHAISERTVWLWLQIFQQQGAAGLAKKDRADKGNLKIRSEHAAWLTALYLGGDAGAGGVELAGERPESAASLHELLQLAVQAGKLPAPAPSLRLIRRWFNEKLPGILADAGRNGFKRALARRGPYIVKSHSLRDLEVADEYQSDFRRLNVLAWTRRDSPLARWWVCRTMDLASRDVADVFDRVPSASLVKSCLRLIYSTLGVPKLHGFDNGKEFTCEEITGKGEILRSAWRFQIADDFDTNCVLSKLGVLPYFSLVENSDGKAELERSFQFFDAIETKLPGWTGPDDDLKPERLKAELRLHRDFQRGLRPDTPLLHLTESTAFQGRKRPGLLPYLRRLVNARYRHRPHSGPGMLGRSPAQVQAAFAGARRLADPAALDLLLWHRRQLTPRGEKIIFDYRGVRLIFRSAALYELPKDALLNVHVDPLNADRAVAFYGARSFLLEPVIPVGRHTDALREEIQRSRRIEKQLRRSLRQARELAEVPGLDERLELYEQDANAKQAALDAHRQDQPAAVPLPAYERAARRLAAAGSSASCPPEPDVALPDYAADGAELLEKEGAD